MRKPIYVYVRAYLLLYTNEWHEFGIANWYVKMAHSFAVIYGFVSITCCPMLSVAYSFTNEKRALWNSINKIGIITFIKHLCDTF